jgi:outer membrane protein OmpA-like peptidoglycan-associated protein
VPTPVAPAAAAAAEEVDTDRDGLTDREEVEIYHTDPLNPDTDWDALKDGAEVHKYRTDPLNPDTDGGKVGDGHEVIVDRTDPRVGQDDLKLFELDMNFAEGQWQISPEYFSGLDAIAKEIKADPAAKVRIEGHVDQRAHDSRSGAKRLTQKRTEAIRDYFADKCQVTENPMTAVGYGFSWPRAANDPVSGNPVNRRMEIYVRSSHQPAGAEQNAPADK